jgi:hypothetical protein
MPTRSESFHLLPRAADRTASTVVRDVNPSIHVRFSPLAAAGQPTVPSRRGATLRTALPTASPPGEDEDPFVETPSQH